MNQVLNKSRRNLFLLGLFSLILSCEDSTVSDNSKTTDVNGITMGFKTTGDVGTEFVLTQENIMEGTISAENNGIEQTGWRFFYPVGKTLFASGYSDDNQCVAYSNDGTGTITQKGGFVFDNALEMFGKSNDDKTFLAMEIPRAGFADRKLHFVDVATGFVTKIQGTRIYESQTDSLIAWPTALEVSGNKLYIPFQKMDAKGNFSTPRADSAFIAIYSYPNVGTSPEKIISDPRTSNIGVNGSTTGLIETETGDLYSFSCGTVSAGFAPASTKPSGILKIASGTSEFDSNYFFNIETATNGGKLFWFDYIGNGKAIARILTDGSGAAWEAYGRTLFNQKLVIIDLINQTVTDVANVPLHAKRYSSPVLVEDGKLFVSIETATDAFVYQVDINTATGTKGAEIKGKTIKGFYRL